MPTTFSAFIRKAIQLGEEDLRRKAKAADAAAAASAGAGAQKASKEPPQAPPRNRGAGPALPDRKPKEGEEPSPETEPEAEKPACSVSWMASRPERTGWRW